MMQEQLEQNEELFVVQDQPLGDDLNYLSALVDQYAGTIEFTTNVGHIFYDLLNYLPYIPDHNEEKIKFCHRITDTVSPLAANLSAETVTLLLTISARPIEPPFSAETMEAYVAFDVKDEILHHCVLSPYHTMPNAEDLSISAGLTVLCRPSHYEYHQPIEDHDTKPRHDLGPKLEPSPIFKRKDVEVSKIKKTAEIVNREIGREPDESEKELKWQPRQVIGYFVTRPYRYLGPKLEPSFKSKAFKIDQGEEAEKEIEDGFKKEPNKEPEEELEYLPRIRLVRRYPHVVSPMGSVWQPVTPPITTFAHTAVLAFPALPTVTRAEYRSSELVMPITTRLPAVTSKSLVEFVAVPRLQTTSLIPTSGPQITMPVMVSVPPAAAVVPSAQMPAAAPAPAQDVIAPLAIPTLMPAVAGPAPVQIETGAAIIYAAQPAAPMRAQIEQAPLAQTAALAMSTPAQILPVREAPAPEVRPRRSEEEIAGTEMEQPERTADERRSEPERKEPRTRPEPEKPLARVAMEELTPGQRMVKEEERLELQRVAEKQEERHLQKPEPVLAETKPILAGMQLGEKTESPRLTSYRSYEEQTQPRFASAKVPSAKERIKVAEAKPAIMIFKKEDAEKMIQRAVIEEFRPTKHFTLLHQFKAALHETTSPLAFMTGDLKPIIKFKTPELAEKVVMPHVAGEGTFQLANNLYEYEPLAQRYWRHKLKIEEGAKPPVYKPQSHIKKLIQAIKPRLRPYLPFLMPEPHPFEDV